MFRLCAPLPPLAGLALGVLLLGFVALRRRALARNQKSRDVDRSTWLLVWLFLVALVGMASFFTYAFLYLGAC